MTWGAANGNINPAHAPEKLFWKFSNSHRFQLSDKIGQLKYIAFTLAKLGVRYTMSDGKVTDKDKTLANTVVRDNCVDFMNNVMQSESVDLTVTSPPYDDLRDYDGYKFSFEDIANGLYRVTKTGGIVVWVVADRMIRGNKTLTSFKQALHFQKIGFNVHDVMIYQKNGVPYPRKNAYTSCHEYMFVFSKGKPVTFNPQKVPTKWAGMDTSTFRQTDGSLIRRTRELGKEKTRVNVWEYSPGYGKSTTDKIAFEHPAIFPEQLAADHILSWSNMGDLVFDPMCGSGTTCKMAMLLYRNYLGVDISQKYVDLANLRIRRATKGLPMI